MVPNHSSPHDALFSEVSKDYRHGDKQLSAAPALVAPSVHLKWYALAPAVLPITAEQLAAAQSHVRTEIEAGRLALKNQVGFVVQHRCRTVMILYVCSWRSDNEIWETLFHQRLPEAPASSASAAKTPARPSASG